MKNETFITQDDLRALFKTLNIQAGANVCIQCSDRFCQSVIGSARSILVVLLETVQERGCIFMPTFTPSGMDPACYEKTIPYESWPTIRNNIFGYHEKLSLSERYKEITNQFLRYEDVIRTEHPVYSFAYTGMVEEEVLKQKNNYPISFTTVLHPFASKKAVNLLLDVPSEHSVLLPAIARTLNQGYTKVQRAYVQKGRSVSSCSFLMTSYTSDDIPELLKYCYSTKQKMGTYTVELLSLEQQKE